MTRRRRWPWIVGTPVAVLALAIGALLRFVSPPAQLSLLDGLIGGGEGTMRVGRALPFGSNGQTLDVWRPSPDGSAPHPRPVVVFWYGGGWVKGDRAAYAFVARAYAAAGFVVVVPDYRKVPGVRFPAFLEDGAQAVRWTVDHVAQYGGDPQRIAFAGHSAGAYEAVMLGLDRRYLTAAGVDPRVVRAVVGLSGPYDFYPFTARRAIDALGNAPDPLATQPITFARTDAPPMLLVTSGNDTEVQPRNAYSLARRLHASGAPVELRDYPRLTHEEVVMALSRPFRGKGAVLADSVAFLHRALGE